MKPTSPLSLYIFLSLTSAAPIVPGRELCNLHGICRTSSRSSFATIFSVFHSKPSAPKNEPHFSKHQLTIEEVLAIPNAHAQSPVAISPSKALEAEIPLESSFLLSLPKSQDEVAYSPGIPTELHPSNTEALPSAPTSLLSELRADEVKKLKLSFSEPKVSKCTKHAQLSEDAIKQEKELLFLRNKLHNALLGSVSSAVTPQEINAHFAKLESVFPTAAIDSIHKSKIHKLLKKIANKKELAHDEEYRFTRRSQELLHAYNRMVGAQRRREAVHGDVLVVGIVVLFVISVVIVEVAHRAFSSIKSFLGFQSHGAIRLPDDDELQSPSRPFRLMPAPKSRKAPLEKIREEV